MPEDRIGRTPPVAVLRSCPLRSWAASFVVLRGGRVRDLFDPGRKHRYTDPRARPAVATAAARSRALLSGRHLRLRRSARRERRARHGRRDVRPALATADTAAACACCCQDSGRPRRRAQSRARRSISAGSLARASSIALAGSGCHSRTTYQLRTPARCVRSSRYGADFPVVGERFTPSTTAQRAIGRCDRTVLMTTVRPRTIQSRASSASATPSAPTR